MVGKGIKKLAITNIKKYNMAILTLQQLQQRHNDEIPKKVFSFEQIQSQAQDSQMTTGNQFQQEKPTGLLGKARDFAAGIVGGGKLAQGIGLATVASGINKQQEQSFDTALKTQSDILSKIREKRAKGEDVSELLNQLKLSSKQFTMIGDQAQDFSETLPTTKEIAGSGLRLAATAASPLLASRIAKVAALGKVKTLGSGIVRGGIVGATTGAIEGGLQGAGLGLEQNQDALGVAKSAGIGATTGAVLGGAIGAVGGGIVGGVRGAKSDEALLKNITPETTEIPNKEYKKLVAQGRITPKTATSPAKYNLSEAERSTALKYREIIDKDPVKTSTNIVETIGNLDDEVGTFLRQNNGIFSKGQLRNAIKESIADVTDLTVDEARLNKAKETLVENFVKSLESNDMESLWLARKEFDRSIESAFKGSPTTSKEIKIAFRNAVQDFISSRTPNTTYNEKMKEMSNLFRLLEIAETKASKEKAVSALGKWAKDNPLKAKAVGWAGVGAAGAVGGALVGNKLGGGDSQ
jgi:hypothetical protein